MPTTKLRPRAILSLQPDAYRRMKVEPEGKVLERTQGVELVSTDTDLSPRGLQAHGGWFEQGRIYLQSPFRHDLYVDAAEAQQVFAMERQGVFLRYCRALGVQSLEVLHVTRSSSESTSTIGGGVTKGAEIKAKLTRNQEAQFVSTLRQKDTFVGGKPDFERAQSILDECGLSTDLEFTNLLELRRGSNPIVEREYEFTVTRSGQQQLQLATSLKVPSFARLSVDYGTVLRVREEYQARLKIKFGPLQKRK